MENDHERGHSFPKNLLLTLYPFQVAYWVYYWLSNSKLSQINTRKKTILQWILINGTCCVRNLCAELTQCTSELKFTLHIISAHYMSGLFLNSFGRICQNCSKYSNANQICLWWRCFILRQFFKFRIIEHRK